MPIYLLPVGYRYSVNSTIGKRVARLNPDWNETASGEDSMVIHYTTMLSYHISGTSEHGTCCPLSLSPPLSPSLSPSF